MQSMRGATMNVSRFFGWFKGRGQTITRTGTADSGIETKLQDRTWQIKVTLYEAHGDKDLRTFVVIERVPSTLRQAKGQDIVIYHGPLENIDRRTQQVYEYADGQVDIDEHYSD